jgi:soluble lytic murein transglycosylase-like protein
MVTVGALATTAAAQPTPKPAPAAQRNVETALLPSTAEFAGATVELPAILSLGDAERYRRILSLQEKGHWGPADREIKRLDSKLLLGQVMAQRYLHPTRYRSRYTELRGWMGRYADHPQARRIYRLAMKRKPRRARAPQRPIVRATPLLKEQARDSDVFYKSSKRRSARQSREARRTIRRVRIHAGRGWLTSARKIVGRKRTRRVLDRVELDIARAYLGSGYFFRGQPKKAFASADAAARRSGRYMPFGHWTAGLAAFQLGSFVQAADHFESMAESSRISGRKQAAAAFWAARSNMLARRPERVNRWLEVAAAHPRTFYGLLSGRVLGIDPAFEWSVPNLTAAHIGIVTRHPAGQRALALLQIGSDRRAELELRGLTGIDDRELGESLLAVASAARLPALSLRTAPMLSEDSGAQHHGALYPVPDWRPAGGFTLDRAVIWAFMRQESRFNIRAKSRSGARGLMQLMPATASFIGRKRYRGARRNLLYKPELNIALGQKYIRHLIDNDLIAGDMALVAAAYNGGPGNLSKWLKRAKRWRYDDRLVFLEIIPSRETRDYVKRVMANLWIYRHRLGQEAPSLDALAAGRAPSYKALDGKGSAVTHARN